jgi:1-acyl-sn-glycerol-3-phosphate acyltransferase
MNSQNELAKFKEGLVTIAHLANVPIYPVYVRPRHKPFRCERIMLGEKINLRDHYQELNTQTCKAMTEFLYDYVNSMKHTLEAKVNK